MPLSELDLSHKRQRKKGERSTYQISSAAHDGAPRDGYDLNPAYRVASLPVVLEPSQRCVRGKNLFLFRQLELYQEEIAKRVDGFTYPVRSATASPYFRHTPIKRPQQQEGKRANDNRRLSGVNVNEKRVNLTVFRCWL